MTNAERMFRYPGAKHKMRDAILEHIAVEDVFFEPMVGSGAISIAVAKKYPRAYIHVNDIDPWVYSFWELVANGTNEQDEQFVDLLDTKPTVEMFYAMRNHRQQDTLSLVESAFTFVFFNRTTFSGMLGSGPLGGIDQAGPQRIDSRYNKDGLKKAYAELVRLLRGRLTATNRSVFDVEMDSGTTYVDPPYVKAGNSLYRYGMTPADHVRLADHLFRSESNWLLSYDNHPLVRELYRKRQSVLIHGSYSVNPDSRRTCAELLITRQLSQ